MAQLVAQAALGGILKLPAVRGTERPPSRLGSYAQNSQPVAIGIRCYGKGEIVFQAQIFGHQYEDFPTQGRFHLLKHSQFGLTTKLEKPPFRSSVPLIASFTAESGYF